MNLNFAAEGLAQKLNIKINKYCICLREEKVTWVVSTMSKASDILMTQ